MATMNGIDPTASDAAVQARLVEVNPMIEAAIAGMQQGLARIGLEHEIDAVSVDGALYTLETDPSDGSQSLNGIWKDANGYYLGSIVVHADNSFFAEYGMAVLHPGKSGWFIDAMTAWGRDSVVKSEPRLLPTL